MRIRIIRIKGLTPIIFDFDIHRILKLAQFCENLDEYDKTSSTSSNPGHPDSDKIQFCENVDEYQKTSSTSSNPGHPDMANATLRYQTKNQILCYYYGELEW
ncbi:hypothetical protein PN492_04815 [Dolichospermum circinale CS-537/01]|uniref:Uncharacterized protein n=1 Tax=Dolichospermum circinale CS-537/01 TaxID=3021739 RepID=A0ABT5A1Q8_9CYAN|nr:hypothetical protein [Dolichospermum circinale]MDB9485872.1 hypothetical protein [Dolichospermum circinale CS-537/01]